MDAGIPELLNPQIKNKLDAILEAGERPLWVGQPAMRLFTPMDILITGFLCLWTYMPIMCLVSYWSKPQTTSDCFFPFYISLFALIGLYMCVGRFIHEFILRKTRFFILTNKRVIALSTFWFGGHRWLDLDRAKDAPFSSRGTVSTLFFNQNELDARTLQLMGMGIAPTLYSLGPAFAFYDIKEGKQLQERIAEAAHDLQNRHSELKKKTDMTEAEQDELIREEERQHSLEDAQKDHNQKQHRKAYIANSLAMAIGGMCALTFGTSSLSAYSEGMADYTASATWPTVQGKIAELKLYKHKDGTEDVRDLVIAYNVNGVEYKCEDYSFVGWRQDEENPAYKLAKEHKVGDPVNILYKPSNPKSSVMSRSWKPSKGMLYMGAGFDAVGVMIFLLILARLAFLGKIRFPEASPKLSIGGSVYRYAFFSVWCTMFFGAILSVPIGMIACAILGIR